MIRVLIVDDQEVIRRGLNFMMSSGGDITVVGQASNGLEALDLYERLQPDVILMDIVMPKMDGVTTTRILHERYSHAKIIIFSALNDEVLSRLLINAGANQILQKDASGVQILEAVRAVCEMSEESS